MGTNMASEGLRSEGGEILGMPSEADTCKKSAG